MDGLVRQRRARHAHRCPGRGRVGERWTASRAATSPGKGRGQHRFRRAGMAHRRRFVQTESNVEFDALCQLVAIAALGRRGFVADLGILVHPFVAFGDGRVFVKFVAFKEDGRKTIVIKARPGRFDRSDSLDRRRFNAELFSRCVKIRIIKGQFFSRHMCFRESNWFKFARSLEEKN